MELDVHALSVAVLVGAITLVSILVILAVYLGMKRAAALLPNDGHDGRFSILITFVLALVFGFIIQHIAEFIFEENGKLSDWWLGESYQRGKSLFSESLCTNDTETNRSYAQFQELPDDQRFMIERKPTPLLREMANLRILTKYLSTQGIERNDLIELEEAIADNSLQCYLSSEDNRLVYLEFIRKHLVLYYTAKNYLTGVKEYQSEIELFDTRVVFAKCVFLVSLLLIFFGVLAYLRLSKYRSVTKCKLIGITLTLVIVCIFYALFIDYESTEYYDRVYGYFSTQHMPGMSLSCDSDVH